MSKMRAILPRSIKRCVFSSELQKAVDKAVDTVYKSHGKKAPFGDFRRTWWRYHCLQLGGPAACPYPPRDCTQAFLRVAELSVGATRPGAMFRVIAKDHAIKRLEAKPLARETESRSPLTRIERGPMDHAASRGGGSGSAASVSAPASTDAMADLDTQRNTLRRPISRPVRIGSLLGSYTPGSREVPTRDEPEGT